MERSRLNKKWNCRLTTTGRKSGQPRTVTIWFVLDGNTAYLTGAGKPPQWARNIKANGDVKIEVAEETLGGRGRFVEDESEAETVRKRFTDKYFMAKIAKMLGRGYTDSCAIVVTLDS